MCYEVHGSSNTNFNLISDTCVSVGAFLSEVGGLNIITSVGIRAEDNDGMCRNIQVNLEGCALSVENSEGAMNTVQSFLMAGVSARKVGTRRVRISVPNCENLRLVMWVICEQEPTNMIRFQVARGLNLAPTSHGLLGQSISYSKNYGSRWSLIFQYLFRSILEHSNFSRTLHSPT